MTFRRVVLVLVLVPVVYLAFLYARRALASPETRIRWVVEEMVSGFNEQRTADVMSGLDRDYFDVRSGVKRQDVHQALVAAFFESVDSNTHEFLLRAELGPEGLVISDLQDDRATVALHVLLYTRIRPPEHLFWDAHIEGEMRKRDGDWRWIKTTAMNLEDRQRFR